MGFRSSLASFFSKRARHSHRRPQALTSTADGGSSECTSTTADSDNAALQLLRPTTGLAAMPTEILVEILSGLDVASQASLSITCKRLRARIPVSPAQLGKCGRWMITCHIASDLQNGKNQLRPDRRYACAFCKETHNWLKFTNPFPNYGYGIRHMDMLHRKPYE